MFEFKKNRKPGANDSTGVPERTEPGLADPGANAAQAVNTLEPKRVSPSSVASMNLAQRMSMDVRRHSQATPEEFERAAGEPAQAELIDELSDQSDHLETADAAQPGADPEQIVEQVAHTQAVDMAQAIQAAGPAESIAAVGVGQTVEAVLDRPATVASVESMGSIGSMGSMGSNGSAQAGKNRTIHSDASEPQSFSGGKAPDPVFGGAPQEPMQKSDIPQFGLPVDTSRSSPKIGAILVANGKMSEENVQAVLALQESEPNARFGELAVRARFVTQKDVDDALAAQFGFSSSSQVSVGLPPEIVTAHNPFSPFAEALRGLRSQLMLRWFDGSPQQCALAVTSVDRADGKSFICANLGVIFSQLGERTLIIDADLRNSTQHLKFGLHNKMGLSGMLSGRAGVEEILAVPGVSNLAVLPAGPIPPNPQELLGREDFSRFLAAMSNTFDVILVDTPSAQQASDAQVVAQRARAAVIVGRKDKTKSTEIGQLGAVMTSAGVKLLGATLNEY